MSGTTANLQDGSLGASKLKLDTTNALSQIQYNSLIDPEQQGSSEDEPLRPELMSPDEAHSAIGVSISREQTRLTSPATPAIEKAAAIERNGAFFGRFDRAEDALVEETDEDDAVDETDEDSRELMNTESEEQIESSTDLTQSTTSEGSPSVNEPKLPSPWRIEPEVQWKTDEKRRSGILDGLFNRKRASTGNQSTIESWQRSFLSSLPSLPKHFSISAPFSSLQSEKQAPEDQAVTSQDDSKPDQSVEASIREPVQLDDTDAEARRASVATLRPNGTLLRRSTSDQSLFTRRTMTRTETLGDDSRFEDVHDQVNSRMKAIKDSWQDANFKIPGMPALKVPSLTAESLRGRVGSLSRKQHTRSVSEMDPARVPLKGQKPVDPMTRQHYHDAKAAVSDMAEKKPIPHPHFHHALTQLEGDVVVLGGYRGSVLRSAQPPHRQVWVPMKVGLNLRKVNLEVGFEEEDDERSTERIIPDGMLTHIGPVDISRRLFKRLRGCENVRTGKLKVWDYGYDWRLMPRHLSGQLIQFLENLPCNQPGVDNKKRGATVIAHSLGGLITRHAVNSRPELFKGVVYAGVPQTCVNILGPLRNGDEVLISNRVLTAQVNFSIRTSFALLPLDGRCFIDKDTKEEYPVDFFDVNTWDDLRLSPCINRCFPPLTPQPKPAGITSYVSSVTSILPNVPLRIRKESERPNEPPKATTAAGTAAPDMKATDGNAAPGGKDVDHDDNVRTAVTISRSEAMEYLARTLASVKRFKEELAFNPDHADANRYPPVAVIYGKSTPTVYGARVSGRDGIRHADAYDDLAFASGDGVVLARAAMVPEGYKAARGGIVASDRGHVTLLSDLEAVGKCLNAIARAQRKGVGEGRST